MKLLRVGGDHETASLRRVTLFAFGKPILSCDSARVSCLAALGCNEAGEKIFCSGKLRAVAGVESPSAMPPKRMRAIKAKASRFKGFVLKNIVNVEMDGCSHIVGGGPFYGETRNYVKLF